MLAVSALSAVQCRTYEWQSLNAAYKWVLSWAPGLDFRRTTLTTFSEYLLVAANRPLLLRLLHAAEKGGAVRVSAARGSPAGVGAEHAQRPLLSGTQRWNERKDA